MRKDLDFKIVDAKEAELEEAEDDSKKANEITSFGI